MIHDLLEHGPCVFCGHTPATPHGPCPRCRIPVRPRWWRGERALPPHLLAWGRTMLRDHPPTYRTRRDPQRLRPHVVGAGLVAWGDALWFMVHHLCAALFVEEPDHVELDPYPRDLAVVQELGPHLEAQAVPVATAAFPRALLGHVRRNRWRRAPDLVRFVRGEDELCVRASFLRPVEAFTDPVVGVRLAEARDDPGQDAPLVLHGGKDGRRVRLVVMPYRNLTEHTTVVAEVRVS